MSEGPTPFAFDAQGEAKRFAPATERNRAFIVAVLQDILPATGTVLEIASGTGEHIVQFAAAFPRLNWQPSDYDDAGLASIAAWRSESGLANIEPPERIDATAHEWPLQHADAMLCINMIHIAPWAATAGLFAGARRLLAGDAPLFLYGPYREADVPTVESNEVFDTNLRSRNAEWGLRQLEDVVALAEQNGFSLDRRIAMPANNLSLVFRKRQA